MGACSRISLWEYRANCATLGCFDPAALAELTCVVRPWSSIASPARPVIHTTSPTLGSPSKIARCPPLRSGLCEQVRAVDLLGMLKEVSVVRQVRPRPIGRTSARGAADIPAQHERRTPMNPPPQPVAIPIEVTVARRCPFRARSARQDHPRHWNLRRPRLAPPGWVGAKAPPPIWLHDGLQARQVVQVRAELGPTILGCVPPGRPSAGVVQVHAAGASGAHLILPPVKHVGRHQSRNREYPLCFELCLAAPVTAAYSAWGRNFLIYSWASFTRISSKRLTVSSEYNLSPQ